MPAISKADGKAWLDLAKSGSTAEMKEMLGTKPSLLQYKQPGIGNSALHWAAARNHEACIVWLTEAGMDPNIVNGSGATALHSAAANDAWETIQLLLKLGCDYSTKDEDGNTARDAAALRDHSKIAAFLETRGHLFKAVEPLLQEAPVGPEPEPETDDGGEQPEMAASEPSRLVDGWMEVPTGDVFADKTAGKAYLDAAKAGDITVVQELLTEHPVLLYYRGKGITFGFVGHSALHWASSKNALPIVQWLVAEKRMNPNVRNNGEATPLMSAAAQGQLEISRVLLKLGADTQPRNSQGNQARDEALAHNHKDIAQAIDHFTLARNMIAEVASGGSWSVKNMRNLLLTASLSADYSEKAEFQQAVEQYLGEIAPLAPAAVLGKDSSVTTQKDKEAAGDTHDSSTDEEEMNDVMEKLLTRQGKTALSLKEEGNASFKLGTKAGYHRAAARYAQALLLASDATLRVTLFSNRAECLIQIGRYRKAIHACNAALQVDPTHEKSMKRKEKAEEAIRKDQEGY